MVVVVVLELVLVDAVDEEVLVELVVLEVGELVVGADVVVEVVLDNDVVVGKVDELVEVVEVEGSVEVVLAMVVEVVTDVVEELVVEEDALELVLEVVLAVVVVLVEPSPVVEDVLVEVVLVVVPPGGDPRSALIRPASIWSAMKLPASFAPSTIRSVDSGAQRCPLMRETRPNVTWLPPTKTVRSRAARPDASSMLALWPMLRSPSTSTRDGASTWSAAFRAERMLQKT